MMEQVRHTQLKKGLLGLFCAIVLVSFDQYTKKLIVDHLRGRAPIVLWEGVFELQYHENTGMIFSILRNHNMLILPVCIAFALVIVFFYFQRIPAERHFFWLNVVAVLFFSGASGNIIDRIVHGYVVDFLYFCLIDFPIFNVADIYVTVAAFLLLYLVFFYYDEDDFDRIIP